MATPAAAQPATSGRPSTTDANAMFAERDAEHRGGEREVARDAGHAPAGHRAGEVRDREAGEPGVTGGVPGGLRQRAPPDPRQHERVEREQQVRGVVDRLRAGAQLEADGGDDAEAAEREQGDEDLGRARRLDHEPGDPLRRGEDEGREREPGPALPEHHADRRGGGDEQERGGRGAELGADEHRRRHGAEDAQAGDALRASQRMARIVAVDATREREREPGRGGDELVALDRDHDAGEQPRDPGRGGRERAVGAAAALVAERAERQQRHRGGGGEQRPRLLADPVARDRDDEEEEQAREQRQAAGPGEHAAAEQVLEGRRGGAARRRAGEGSATRGAEGGATERSGVGRGAGPARRRGTAARLLRAEPPGGAGLRARRAAGTRRPSSSASRVSRRRVRCSSPCTRSSIDMPEPPCSLLTIGRQTPCPTDR